MLEIWQADAQRALRLARSTSAVLAERFLQGFRPGRDRRRRVPISFETVKPGSVPGIRRKDAGAAYPRWRCTPAACCARATPASTSPTRTTNGDRSRSSRSFRRNAGTTLIAPRHDAQDGHAVYTVRYPHAGRPARPCFSKCDHRSEVVAGGAIRPLQTREAAPRAPAIIGSTFVRWMRLRRY